MRGLTAAWLLAQDFPPRAPSHENLVINELLREYLEYNGYKQTLTVFLPESGQPLQKPFKRGFLAHELQGEAFEQIAAFLAS